MVEVQPAIDGDKKGDGRVRPQPRLPFCPTSADGLHPVAARPTEFGYLFEVILGGIDAGLGAGLILIAGGSADADRADLHFVRGHNR